MYYLIDDMGIEMNHKNPDYHVTESESNNRVIEDIFRFVYFKLLYKIIPRIVIHHLVMNVTQIFNLFPSEGGVLACYRQHMLMPQSILDYNKLFLVEFGAYVQVSQVNNTKNTNRPRTLDGIYLFSAPNLQGGHHTMDLWMGQLITVPKVSNIPITDALINAFEKWRRIRYLSH